MSVKLLTEHNLEFLSLKGGCTGSSESKLVKMPHCWKSHVTAQIMNSHAKLWTSFPATYIVRTHERQRGFRPYAAHVLSVCSVLQRLATLQQKVRVGM